MKTTKRKFLTFGAILCVIALSLLAFTGCGGGDYRTRFDSLRNNFYNAAEWTVADRNGNQAIFNVNCDENDNNCEIVTAIAEFTATSGTDSVTVIFFSSVDDARAVMTSLHDDASTIIQQRSGSILLRGTDAAIAQASTFLAEIIS